MFKKYGLVGILLIVFVEINFFLKIQPFANWYFPIVWLGYIFIIDALIYKLRKNSLITNHPLQFIGILFLSIPFWHVFEFLNLFFLNWLNTPDFTGLIRFVSAAFIFTGFYETYLLIRTLHLFDKIKLKKSYKITKQFLNIMILISISECKFSN